MEKINSLFFGIFALILSAVYLATLNRSSNRPNPLISQYWHISVIARIFAFASWGLAPYAGMFCLFLANFSFIFSAINLPIFFRMWRVKVSKKLIAPAYALILVVASLYLYFLFQANSFISRFNLIGFTILLITLWELKEIVLNVKIETSYLLKVILVLAFLQATLSIMTLYHFNIEGHENINNLLQGNAPSTIFLWVTLSTHLLSYILVSSFMYEKLWVAEKNTYQGFINSREKLDLAKKEKYQIELLLKEKEILLLKLLKANKTASTGALAASFAHEINQPLTVIQLNAEMLHGMIDELKQPFGMSKKDLISEILQATNRAASTIHSLKSIFVGGNEDFQEENINDLIISVIKIVQPELDRQKIVLKSSLHGEMLAVVNFGEIQQVLLNLLSNATKALQHSNFSQSEIHIEAFVSNQKLTVSVSDNGNGVGVNQESDLFSILIPAQDQNSMGLGLWLCQYILERHQGKIYYERSRAGGAKFTFILPTKLS